MTFNAKQQRAIKRWISRTTPIKGLFFRSVEYRYMDPLDVLSGAGARAYGGRFAPVGTRAVYLSVTDSGASKEVTARKSRLGGVGQISVEKYPRVCVRGRRRFEEIAQPFHSWIVTRCRSDQGCLSG